MDIKQFFGIKPELTEYSILSEKIPSGFDGFRIAHISDIHSSPANGIYELVEKSVPDMICITGDMFHDNNSDAPEFWELFRKLRELAPVYLVSGNHDLWHNDSAKMLRRLIERGGVLLDTEMSVFERNGDRIGIFGVGDPFSKVPVIIERNIKREFSRLPQFDGYKILLYHRANLFDRIKDRGFDLILSGHMHGGQVRLPLLGGALAPTSAVLSGRMVFPSYTGGKFEYGGCTMIVNRGAGNTILIPRLNNPPEVGIITLKTKGMLKKFRSQKGKE